MSNVHVHHYMGEVTRPRSIHGPNVPLADWREERDNRNLERYTAALCT